VLAGQPVEVRVLSTAPSHINDLNLFTISFPHLWGDTCYKPLNRTKSRPHHMRNVNVRLVLKHLEAAIALLQELDPRPSQRKWFGRDGPLTDGGIEHLHSLFAAGTSTYRAAKEMGLSYRAAALRRKRWQNHNIVL
jgi:hypothetical protein